MTDNLTHSLFGYLLGSLIIRKLKFKNQRLPMIAMIVAANLPDIDFIIRFFGAGFYLVHHREISHSLIGILLLSIIIAAAFSKLKKAEFNKYFLIGLVGTLSHLFLDIITSWGTQVLYPFNNIRYEFSLIPIVDVYVLAIFIVGIILINLNKVQKEKIAKATLFIFMVFLLFKSGLKIYADNAVENLDNYENVKVLPSLSSPFKWRAIITEPDMYIVNDFDVSTTGFGEFHFYPKEDDPLIEKSKATLVVKQFLEFSQYPYAKLENNIVRWYDLRITRDGSGGINAIVKFDEQGNIASQGFSSI